MMWNPKQHLNENKYRIKNKKHKQNQDKQQEHPCFWTGWGADCVEDLTQNKMKK